MILSPKVSVVMSVHNGARYLQSAVSSILEQQGVDLELIVINDGSTDDSGAVLSMFAAGDARLRVFHQANAGLTKSLVRGCQLARGAYIARHDSDDLSMPGRLQRQCDVLDEDPGVGMVSSWAEVIGPSDEPLLTHRRPARTDTATELLLHGGVGPPGHGSVMFRRELYERVGGYREVFYYAQDSDLWLRMGLEARLAYVQDVLYRYRISAESISGRLDSAKQPYARLVADLHRARLDGESEAPILQRAAAQLGKQGGNSERGSEDATLYFIAKCLFNRRDPRARGYLRECIASNPRNYRAWCLLPLAHAQALLGRAP